MKRLLFATLAIGAVAAVQAQPVTFFDLGTITSSATPYSVADRAVGVDLDGPNIVWLRFDFPNVTSASGFYFDIDVFATNSVVADTEIGLYDNAGAMIANDDDQGHSLMSALTFGNTTARTMPSDPFGFTNGVAANGRDGNIGPGRYWLAVGLFNTAFGATNWDVTSTSTGDPNTVVVNFRTDAPVPEPASIAALGLGAAALLRRRRRS